MEDRSQEVLQKYDFRIYNTYRTRGAYVLETDQGLKLLCLYEGSDQRLEFENSVKHQVYRNGYERVDLFNLNKENSVLSTNTAGDKYYIKDWFDGEECSLKKEDKVLLAVRNLAKLHSCMDNICLTEEQKTSYVQGNLLVILEKRIRELKRVKTYIRERKQKNEFEVYYLTVCEKFYEDANRAYSLLKQIPYEKMRFQAISDGVLCHGSYTYHNIFLLRESEEEPVCKAAQVADTENIATTNFEKAECGLQLMDLYYFLRKTMEKNDWEISLGDKIIAEYDAKRCLSQDERKLLYILVLFPEKFWKITNYYFNSKKSWIPQKNVQKLQMLGEQMEAKRKFLLNLQVE